MKIRTFASLQRLHTGAVLLLAMLVLTACATGPVIFSNESPAANFPAYRTYTFAENLGTDDRPGVRSLLSQYLAKEIAGQMTARGYEQVSEGADLTFDFALVTKEKLRSVPSANFGGYYYGGYPYYGGYYGGFGDTYRITQYTEGTLSIVIVDNATSGVVWEGGSIARVTDEIRDNLDAAARQAVTEIFSRYPYYAAGKTPPAAPADAT